MLQLNGFLLAVGHRPEKARARVRGEALEWGPQDLAPYPKLSDRGWSSRLLFRPMLWVLRGMHDPIMQKYQMRMKFFAMWTRKPLKHARSAADRSRIKHSRRGTSRLSSRLLQLDLISSCTGAGFSNETLVAYQLNQRIQIRVAGRGGSIDPLLINTQRSVRSTVRDPETYCYRYAI